MRVVADRYQAVYQAGGGHLLRVWLPAAWRGAASEQHQLHALLTADGQAPEAAALLLALDGARWTTRRLPSGGALEVPLSPAAIRSWDASNADLEVFEGLTLQLATANHG